MLKIFASLVSSPSSSSISHCSHSLPHCHSVGRCDPLLRSGGKPRPQSGVETHGRSYSLRLEIYHQLLLSLGLIHSLLHYVCTWCMNPHTNTHTHTHTHTHTPHKYNPTHTTPTDTCRVQVRAQQCLWRSDYHGSHGNRHGQLQLHGKQ